MRYTSLVVCAIACGAPKPNAEAPASSGTIEVTIEEVKQVFREPPEPESDWNDCADLYKPGRRSCVLEGVHIPTYLPDVAQGGLFIEGFGLKDHALALHVSDKCFHYLCDLKRPCMDEVRDPARYHRECVNYANCCVAVVDH